MALLIYKHAWRRRINSAMINHEAIIFIVTNARYVIMIRNQMRNLFTNHV